MFEIDLEIILVYFCPADGSSSSQEKELDENIKISGKVTEKNFEIPVDNKWAEDENQDLFYLFTFQGFKRDQAYKGSRRPSHSSIEAW